MPMTPQAAKRYKPRRPGMTLDDVTDEAARKRQEQMTQEARDAAMQPKLDEAYEKSRTTFAAGGSASKRADGIAQKGKTRGTIVMCGGGMYKK